MVAKATAIKESVNTKYWKFILSSGYNMWGGSHFDLYIIDYYTYIPYYNEANAFDKPTPCDNPFTPVDPYATQGSAGSRIQTLLKTHLGGKKHSVGAQFAKFQAKYGKYYATAKETAKRQGIFSDRLAMINEHNANPNKTFTMALNHLADLSNEEVQHLYTGHSPSNDDRDNWDMLDNYKEHTFPTYDSYAPIDWRLSKYNAAGPVRDQAACGSCWTFGAMGSLSGRLAIANKEFVQLSEQRVVDCVWTYSPAYPDYRVNNGCNGGDSGYALDWLCSNGSTADEDYPYLGVNDYCKIDQGVDAKFNFDHWEGVENWWDQDDTAHNFDDLYTALLSGPVAIAVAVPDSFIYYASGIYDDENCGGAESDLAHAVTLVGYGEYNDPTDADAETVPYWIVKNSWSPLWGDNGFIYIKADPNVNRCGVATEASYPVV
eukprot:gnl/Carplike_NY0171/476_a661_3511.p1 GENE.gnl/Carplike_NY0171/476_a661_3511~~gnl/Carplike_NY0171/476_a661_3511.p1  ORF type:complete len:432 (+),score=128.70 gnl/Carplike_NY0171/476_a661_3511:477-1772(+)